MKKNKTETHRYGCGCIVQRTKTGRTNLVRCGNSYCWGKAWGKSKEDKHQQGRGVRLGGRTNPLDGGDKRH